MIFAKITVVQNRQKIVLIWLLVCLSRLFLANIFANFNVLLYFIVFVRLMTKMNSVTNGSVNSNALQKFKSAFSSRVPTYKGNL